MRITFYLTTNKLQPRLRLFLFIQDKIIQSRLTEKIFFKFKMIDLKVFFYLFCLFKPIEHYSRSSGTRTPRPTLPQRQPSPLMNPASNVSKLRTSRPSTSSRQSDRRQASLSPQRKSQQQETITDGTIRYVKSRHGFEVQHFMSKNCLKIDVFSKDACQEQDKPFREMLEKKQQYERLSKSIYSSEYYQNRWNELVKSYKYENLSHAEWAKQNYQELCLRTLYGRAAQREYADQLNYNEKQREIRAHSAFQQWRDVKDKERLQQQRSRLTTAQSQGQTETRFFGANASFTVPMTTSTEDLTTSIGDTSYRMSISTNEENELHTNSLNKTEINEQKPLAEEKEDLRLYDPDRWSIHSMLKRVVGLSEPLSKVSKSSSVKKASSPSASSDSGFESV